MNKNTVGKHACDGRTIIKFNSHKCSRLLGFQDEIMEAMSTFYESDILFVTLSTLKEYVVGFDGKYETIFSYFVYSLEDMGYLNTYRAAISGNSHIVICLKHVAPTAKSYDFEMQIDASDIEHWG